MFLFLYAICPDTWKVRSFCVEQIVNIAYKHKRARDEAKIRPSGKLRAGTDRAQAQQQHTADNEYRKYTRR